MKKKIRKRALRTAVLASSVILVIINVAVFRDEHQVCIDSPVGVARFSYG
jgi:hypothetical protein